MGWFALGIIYNLRRGDAMLKWMQGGLPKIGERTTFRWLGSSVAELVIGQAKKPFRQLDTLLVLAPRDVPWLWAFGPRCAAASDTLIFRAQLGAAPKVDLELADPRSYTGRMGVNDVTNRGWESQPYGDLQLYAPKGYLDLARATVEALTAQRASARAHLPPLRAPSRLPAPRAAHPPARSQNPRHCRVLRGLRDLARRGEPGSRLTQPLACLTLLERRSQRQARPASAPYFFAVAGVAFGAGVAEYF